MYRFALKAEHLTALEIQDLSILDDHQLFLCAVNQFDKEMYISSKRTLSNFAGHPLSLLFKQDLLKTLKFHMKQDGYPLHWNAAQDWLESNS